MMTRTRAEAALLLNDKPQEEMVKLAISQAILRKGQWLEFGRPQDSVRGQFCADPEHSLVAAIEDLVIEQMDLKDKLGREPQLSAEETDAVRGRVNAVLALGQEGSLRHA